MEKKDLIVAVLATFCLSVTLFTILPTKSATYDPWADLSGNGKIDIYDVVDVTSIYGTTGNSTKNVTVTNWPSTIIPKDSTFAYFSDVQYLLPLPDFHYLWVSEYLSTGGFRQITVHIYTNASVSVDVFQDLQTQHPASGTTMDLDSLEVQGNQRFTRTYNVKGDHCYLVIRNLGTPTAMVTCWVYMNSIPSIETDPVHNEQRTTINASSSGGSWSSNIECGGYSRMAINPKGAYPVTNGTYDITFYLWVIQWDGQNQFLPTGAINITIYVNKGVVGYIPGPPFMTETKASQCRIIWAVAASHNVPPNWSVTFYVDVYLRNE